MVSGAQLPIPISRGAQQRRYGPYTTPHAHNARAFGRPGYMPVTLQIQAIRAPKGVTGRSLAAPIAIAELADNLAA